MSIKKLQRVAWVLVVGASLSAGEPLTVSEAIQKAWRDQSGLKAGQAMVDSRQAEAEGYRDLRLPTLTLNAQGVNTNEPMMAFGIKLNQARIGMADFNPATLNHPEAIGAYGGSAVIQQPLYTGGRLTAARRAGEFMFQAEQASQEHRKQETARMVVEAYFGAQVAEQALLWVDDTLTWVKGLESFVGARVDQGLMLESERQRLLAVHAQVDAQRAEIHKQVLAARSGLGLLTGTGPVEGPLGTPLEPSAPVTGAKASAATRGDLAAADWQAKAAAEGAKAAQGVNRPEVGLELGAGTLHHSWSDKGNWTWAGIGLKWKVFSAPDRAKVQAANAQARAASEMRNFKQQQAEHEVRVARESVVAAEARTVAAKASLAAAEESKRLREARYKEGLLPLIEVLDADAAVQGARTLILQSLYDLRVSHAALDLATGQPVEGVNP
jgi:outer membrane protein TolC